MAEAVISNTPSSSHSHGLPTNAAGKLVLNLGSRFNASSSTSVTSPAASRATTTSTQHGATVRAPITSSNRDAVVVIAELLISLIAIFDDYVDLQSLQINGSLVPLWLSIQPSCPMSLILVWLCIKGEAAAQIRSCEAFEEFQRDVVELQFVDLESLDHDHKLAFFLNLYNLICMHTLAILGPPQSGVQRYVYGSFGRSTQ
jgi:hypothetical protein